MPYSVKELFFTLQGEGARAGRASVFCRFSGCNLWTGREADRARGTGGCSLWCDTDFVGTNGAGGGKFVSASDLAAAIRHVWDSHVRDGSGSIPYVVCTGGEPLLQVDAPLVEALHARGFEVAVETNGTLPVPLGIDWVCVSPKSGTRCVVEGGHELKLVYPQPGVDPCDFDHLRFDHRFLQPLDGPDRPRSTEAAVSYCQQHPRWRLSVQTHKWLGIR